jgi:hypothetical protein
MVTIINLASLSILELIEYGINHHDVNQALSKGILQFDKSSDVSQPGTPDSTPERQTDLYFKYLVSKVKLTDLGIYVLETISKDPLPILSENDPAFYRSTEDKLPFLDAVNSLGGP